MHPNRPSHHRTHTATHIISHLTRFRSHMFDGDLHRKCTNYVFTDRRCRLSLHGRVQFDDVHLNGQKGTGTVALAIRQNKQIDKKLLVRRTVAILTCMHPFLPNFNRNKTARIQTAHIATLCVVILFKY